MGAVWLYARSDLQRRWRGLVVIALILGLAGAFALTALVGARRAATAWDRFRTETRAPDAFVSIPSRNDSGATEELRSLPGVAEAAGFIYVAIAPPGMPEGGAFAAADGSLGTTVSRPRIVRGRRARPETATEVTINPAMAEATGAVPGTRLRLVGQGESDFSVRVAVVGVHLGTLDVSLNATFPSALLTPAFLARYGEDVEVGRQNQFVRLEKGDQGVPAFRAAAIRHFGASGGVLVGGAAEEDTGITDALGLQATSLALVAAMAALATLVAVGQALARHASAMAGDAEALVALGLTRREHSVATLPGVAVVAVGGAAVAVITTMLASPLVPTGLARRINPRPGVTTDAVVLAGGGALLAGIAMLAGATLAARALRRSRVLRTTHRPRAAAALASLGPTAMVGIRHAFGTGHGAVRSTSRSAVAAAVASTLAVAAAGTFAVSLDHLTHTPKLYGWDFDALVGTGGEDPDEVNATAEALVADQKVERVAVVEVDFFRVGDHSIEIHVLDQLKGAPIHPTLADGRAPAGPGEIALGSKTMKELGVGLGDRIEAVAVDGTVHLTVVGVGVYPTLGDGTIANAASITAAAAAGLRLEESRGRLVMVDVGPGSDPSAVIRRHTDMFVSRPLPPSEITNLRQVGSAPWAVAGFFGLLGLAAVGHALVLSVRAGRRSFAVVRALGFTGGQVRATVCWQASAIVVLGLVGLPLGLIAGRWTWMAVASGTGALAEPVVPAVFLALAVAVFLVAGNAVATIPGQLATRMRPAEVLRTE